MATDGHGLQIKAEITDLQKESLLAEIIQQKDDPEASAKITVALGLLKKRDRLEFALEKLTELGVYRMILFQGDHSERGHARLDRLEGIIQSALKQSLGSWLPKLNIVDSLEDIFGLEGMDSVEEIYLADETLETQSLAGEMHEDETPETQTPRKRDVTESIAYSLLPHRLLLIGPEGGFSKRERDWLASHHPECRALSLGKRRLRAETAAIAGLLSLQQGS